MSAKLVLRGVVASLAVSILLLPPGAARAEIRYVWTNSPAEGPPYTNWDMAAHSITTAVNAASGGDEVVVTDGVYVVNSPIMLTKAVVLRSVNGFDATTVDGNATNRCIYLNSTGAVVEGFTVTRGKAADGGGVYMLTGGTVRACNIISNRAFSAGVTSVVVRGGGIYIKSTGLVTNCVIAGNLASGNWYGYGGGVYVESTGVVWDCSISGNSVTQYFNESYGGGVFAKSGAIVRACTISSNTAWSAYSSSVALGGGVCLQSGGTLDLCTVRANRGGNGAGAYLYGGGTVTNCTLAENEADYGGGFYASSGGLVVDTRLVANRVSYSGGGGAGGGTTVRGCTISGNRAVWGGGGIMAQGNAMVEACAVSNNTAVLSPGGGLYFLNPCTARNALIVSNSAAGQGGGVVLAGGKVESCTVSGNRSGQAGGGVSGSGAVLNSIVHGNTAPLDREWTGTLAFTNSCTAPASGPGCTAASPEFAGPLSNEFHLLPGSPGIDTGTNQAWMTTDLAGRPRVLNGRADMGCYEFETNRLAVNALADRTAGFPPLAVVFTLSVAGTNTGGVSCRWDFDNDGSWDPRDPSAAVVTNVYPAVGLYSVAVEVSNGVGETAALVKPDYVQVAPAVTYAAPGAASAYPFDHWGRAATNIQDAVDAGIEGTVVLVSNGTYALTREIQVSRGVTVSGFCGAAAAIVDGQGATRCFTLAHTNAVIAALTIRNGGGVTEGGGVYAARGGTLDGCVIRGNHASSYGGGVYAYSGSTLRGCRLEENTADSQGGGIYLAYASVLDRCAIVSNAAYGEGGGVYADDGTPLIQGCSIETNEAEAGGGLYLYSGGTVRDCTIAHNYANYYDGGGLYTEGDAVVIEGCTVRSNATYGAGGGLYFYGNYNTMSNCLVDGNTAEGDDGGGLYMYYGDHVIRRSVFTRNRAPGSSAGGVYCYSSRMEDCTLQDNACASDGGGVYLYDGQLVNCLITSNTAQRGAGVYLWYGVVQNCTVARNAAALRAGGVFEVAGTNRNTIIYFNTAPTNANRGGAGVANAYCCTLPAAAGTGNITNNPLFADADAGNFRIIATSPCVDKATAANSPNHDIEGTVRPLDGDGNAVTNYDIGAYEYRPLPPSQDTDSDGLTDAQELYIYSTDPGRRDTDGDGLGDGAEVYAGTSPRNMRSVFAMAGVTPLSGPPGTVVTWTSVTGKHYSVMSGTNLTLGFEPLFTNVPAWPPENSCTDSVGGAGVRFYRIKVE